MTERDLGENIPEDLFVRLRETTPARIGLGRVGDGLPTKALLEFQEAHAKARDAVWTGARFAELEGSLEPWSVERVASAAPDRQTYLRRPDLGRRLRESDRLRLGGSKTSVDLLLVVADGLSADAAHRFAPAVVRATLALCPTLRLGPIVLAEQARVALGDELGELYDADLVAILIGERPGLSVPASLGIYLTWQARPGTLDSARTCISNIHPEGLSTTEAAERLHSLIVSARRDRRTGLELASGSSAQEIPQLSELATE